MCTFPRLCLLFDCDSATLYKSVGQICIDSSAITYVSFLVNEPAPTETLKGTKHVNKNVCILCV